MAEDPIVVKVSALGELTDLATDDLLQVVDVSEELVANKTKKMQAGSIKVFTASQITDGILTNSKLADNTIENAKLKVRVTPITLIVLGADELWTTGDGKMIWDIPTELDGATLTEAQCICRERGTGTLTVSLGRGRRAVPTSAYAYSDMLTTPMTIDAGTYNSKDAAVQRVISGTYNTVLAYDVISVNIDAAGASAKGLNVILGLYL